MGIGMLVVVAMLGGPPESTLLGGHAAEEGEAKLEKAAGLITAMGKIAVESAGDTEFTDEKHEGAKGGSLDIDSGPDNGKAYQMDQDEKNSRNGDVKVTMHRTYNMEQTGRGTT